MQTGVPFTRISFAVAPRGQSAPLGAAPARLLRPIRPRPTAPGRSALSGRGRPIITAPQPLRDCWSQPPPKPPIPEQVEPHVFNGDGEGLPPSYKAAGSEHSYTHDIGFSGVLRKDQSGNS